MPIVFQDALPENREGEGQGEGHRGDEGEGGEGGQRPEMGLCDCCGIEAREGEVESGDEGLKGVTWGGMGGGGGGEEEEFRGIEPGGEEGGEEGGGGWVGRGGGRWGGGWG